MIFHAPKQTWWMPSCPYQVALAECLMPDSTSDGIRVAIQSEYLAGEVSLSIGRNETIRPHAEPTRAELEPLLKHPDSDLSEAAWESLVAYQRRVYEDTTGDNPISREGSKHNRLMDLVSAVESLTTTASTMEELKNAEKGTRQAKQEKKTVETKLNAEKKGRQQDKAKAKRKEIAREEVEQKGRTNGTATNSANGDARKAIYRKIAKAAKKKYPGIEKDDVVTKTLETIVEMLKLHTHYDYNLFRKLFKKVPSRRSVSNAIKDLF